MCAENVSFHSVKMRMQCIKCYLEFHSIIFQSLAKDHSPGVTSAESTSVLQLQQLKVQIF